MTGIESATTPPNQLIKATDGRAFEQNFCIDANHPVLPGHFPGHPLVPGVMLLEQVALALRRWRDLRIARVLEAKFVAPLLPGESARVRLTPMASIPAHAPPENPRVRFEIFRADVPLARGVIEGAA